LDRIYVRRGAARKPLGEKESFSPSGFPPVPGFFFKFQTFLHVLDFHEINKLQAKFFQTTTKNTPSFIFISHFIF